MRTICVLIVILISSGQLNWAVGADIDYSTLGERLRNDESLSREEREWVRKGQRQTGLTRREFADKVEQDWENSERLEKIRKRRQKYSDRQPYSPAQETASDSDSALLILGLGVLILGAILSGYWLRREIRMRRLESGLYDEDCL